MVQLLRDSLGTVRCHRIELTQTASLYASPAHQLRPGDVGNVAPNKYRQREAKAYGDAWHKPHIYTSLLSVLTSGVPLLLAL